MSLATKSTMSGMCDRWAPKYRNY